MPIKGWYGRVMALLHFTPPSAVTSSFFTRSGNGLFSSAVAPVPTKPPNSGIRQVVPTGCGPRGWMDWMWTARQSPFCAPLTKIGPFCGLR